MKPRSSRRGVLLCAAIMSLMVSNVALPKPQPETLDLPTAARIRRVENGIPPIPLGSNEPPMQLGVAELMKAYKVPGLSVAVIDNFKIAWTKAYGVTEVGSANPVTVHTLFQAGSISKPVAATGALYLGEHGKLSLDENVNDKLKSWQVPDNEF